MPDSKLLSLLYLVLHGKNLPHETRVLNTLVYASCWDVDSKAPLLRYLGPACIDHSPLPGSILQLHTESPFGFIKENRP